MLSIRKYLDIPYEERDGVLEQLFSLGFRPAYGKQKTLKREMEKSQENKLPQYIFAFQGEKLIGYAFLIGEKENNCRVFPCWAVHNADELPPETAVRLLEYAAGLCASCGDAILADRVTAQLAKN